MNIVIANMPQIEAGIRKALQSYAEQVTRANMAATWDTAVDIMSDAKSQTPVVTGHLLDSAMVGGPYRDGNTAESEVGYTAEYAAQVHEDMQGRHPKFLERAVMSVGPNLRDAVLKELR